MTTKPINLCYSTYSNAWGIRSMLRLIREESETATAIWEAEVEAAELPSGRIVTPGTIDGDHVATPVSIRILDDTVTIKAEIKSQNGSVRTIRHRGKQEELTVQIDRQLYALGI